jgi:adenine-specific DNA-methyltransferase
VAYRYLGNKTRIAEWIASTVSNILPKNAKIADPMCGTATMSEAFANRGMQVVASDELRFPVLHAKARLLHNRRYNFTKVASSYMGAIEKLNGLGPVKGFFWNEYSDDGSPVNGAKPRKYFTGENAARIDAIRAIIKEWRDAGLSDAASDLLLHDLILSVNDVANIAGTYGYYRSSWNSSSIKPLLLKPSEPIRYPVRHSTLQGKVEKIASKLKVDGCYLDPPYTKRQYGGNYHILETIAQEDEPVPVGEGGLRDWYPQSSAYCYKRRVRGAFHDTMKQLQSRWIFVSYSEDGHIPPEELHELLSEYGDVKRLDTPIERFRSNNAGKSGHVHEHLYIVEK